MSDGCTGWLDGWPTWLGGTGAEWVHCCEAHDTHYAADDPVLRLLQAHLELGRCVWEVSPAMAIVMVAGLFTFGTLFIIGFKNRYGRIDRQ